MQALHWILTIMFGLLALTNASLFGMCVRDGDKGEAVWRGIFAVLWLVVFGLYAITRLS